MSTNIEHGRLWRDSNAFNITAQLRTQLTAARNELYEQTLCDLAIRVADNNGWGDNGFGILGASRQLDTFIKAAETSRSANNPLDLSVTVQLMSLGDGDIYSVSYATQHVYHNIVAAGSETFAWWDTPDRPADVDEHTWGQRQHIWEQLRNADNHVEINVTIDSISSDVLAAPYGTSTTLRTRIAEQLHQRHLDGQPALDIDRVIYGDKALNLA